MSDVIITPKTLLVNFKNIGLLPGMNLIVHSSLKQIGRLHGDVPMIISTLQEIITGNGTLIMPAHTCGNSNPQHWQNPPAPKEQWKAIKQNMHPFESKKTPSANMGRIAESFRSFPNVFRSNHPNVSFSAWGKNAEHITHNHSLEYGLGEKSPLAKLYALNAYVLLIGVGYDTNTALHLAEYRANYTSKKQLLEGARILDNGKSVWKEFAEIKLDDEDFPALGKDFESKTNVVKTGQIGNAASKLMPIRELVDFGVKWIELNRK